MDRNADNNRELDRRSKEDEPKIISCNGWSGTTPGTNRYVVFYFIEENLWNFQYKRLSEIGKISQPGVSDYPWNMWFKVCMYESSEDTCVKIPVCKPNWVEYGQSRRKWGRFVVKTNP